MSDFEETLQELKSQGDESMADLFAGIHSFWDGHIERMKSLNEAIDSLNKTTESELDTIEVPNDNKYDHKHIDDTLNETSSLLDQLLAEL